MVAAHEERGGVLPVGLCLRRGRRRVVRSLTLVEVTAVEREHPRVALVAASVAVRRGQHRRDQDDVRDDAAAPRHDGPRISREPTDGLVAGWLG